MLDILRRTVGAGPHFFRLISDNLRSIASNISACKCYEKAGGINDADDEVVYVYDFREEN